jgi:hypothetical protein
MAIANDGRLRPAYSAAAAFGPTDRDQIIGAVADELRRYDGGVARAIAVAGDRFAAAPIADALKAAVGREMCVRTRRLAA